MNKIKPNNISKPLIKNKIARYISFFSLIVLFSCEASNIIDSSIESSLSGTAEASIQSSDWFLGYLSGPSQTTNHAPQSNNMTDGKLYQTAGHIHYQFQDLFEAGTANWIPSDRPPSVVDDYMAYLPSGSSQLRFGVINLQYNQVQTSPIPGATSSTGPTMVKYQGDIYVFFKGKNNNDIYMIKSSNGGGNWTSTTKLFGNTNTIVGATVFNNRIYIFHKGDSTNNIYYRYMNSSGTWSGSHQVSGSSTPSTPTVRTNTSENKLYLVYRGGNDYVYYRTMNTSGSWTSPNRVEDSNSNAPKTSSAPDVYFSYDENFIAIMLREKSSSRIMTMQKYY